MYEVSRLQKFLFFNFFHLLLFVDDRFEATEQAQPKQLTKLSNEDHKNVIISLRF